MGETAHARLGEQAEGGAGDVMGSRPATLLRDAKIAALSQSGPAPFLRSFEGIADWRPPQRPYASDEVRNPADTP